MAEELYWQAEDQAERLAELLSADEELKNRPLRRDVRSLGRLLGTVIREQAGKSTYTTEEEIRQLAIRHRELHDPHGDADLDAPGERELLARASGIIAGLSAAEAHQIIKAFSTFFELTNLAETNHRKRRRRADRLVLSFPDKSGSLRGTLRRLRESGLGAEEALALLRQVEVIPVFTAHPTEVARRVVRYKRRRIAGVLEELDRLPLGEAEAARGQRTILAEITALWQSDEVRRRQPTVGDEIRMGLDHYPDSLIEPLPGLYQDVALAFRQVYGLELAAAELPNVVRFGSWIGGDRDGNPYVTTGATREALQKARETILDYYLAAAAELRELLTPSTCRVPATGELTTAVEGYRQQLPAAAGEAAHYPECEYYRQFLRFIGYRLQQARLDPRTPPGLPGRRRLRCRPGAGGDQPAGRRRRAPGAGVRGAAAPATGHLRFSPAHPRHPPARPGARRRRGRTGGGRRLRRPASCRRPPRRKPPDCSIPCGPSPG